MKKRLIAISLSVLGLYLLTLDDAPSATNITLLNQHDKRAEAITPGAKYLLGFNADESLDPALVGSERAQFWQQAIRDFTLDPSVGLPSEYPYQQQPLDLPNLKALCKNNDDDNCIGEMLTANAQDLKGWTFDTLRQRYQHFLALEQEQLHNYDYGQIPIGYYTLRQAGNVQLLDVIISLRHGAQTEKLSPLYYSLDRLRQKLTRATRLIERKVYLSMINAHLDTLAALIQIYPNLTTQQIHPITAEERDLSRPLAAEFQYFSAMLSSSGQYLDAQTSHPINEPWAWLNYKPNMLMNQIAEHTNRFIEFSQQPIGQFVVHTLEYHSTSNSAMATALFKLIRNSKGQALFNSYIWDDQSATNLIDSIDLDIKISFINHLIQNNGRINTQALPKNPYNTPEGYEPGIDIGARKICYQGPGNIQQQYNCLEVAVDLKQVTEAKQ